MSLQIRLRFTKALLRRAERLSFGFGFACMGLCAFMLAQAWFFQAYQDWAFDQQSRGEAVSVSEFLAQSASFSGPDDTRFVASLAARSGEAQTIGFHSPEDRAVLGRIEIPRIGLKAMILEGVSQRTLALAVGHIPGTALPGKTGNAGIAGHRDTFFHSLQGIHENDAIVVTTPDGSYRYRVNSCAVVGPRDTRVLEDSTQPSLTLVTCYPFRYLGPAPERFIVHAVREPL
jgi:LPXTG-site transpeptidase (sortase) family protein